MPNRSQRHKRLIQGRASDGGSGIPVVAAALVNQAGTNNVAGTYTFAVGSFTVQVGALTYSARSVVGGVSVPLVAGITFDPATRIIAWNKPTGVYIVRITAQSSAGWSAYSDTTITVT